MNQAPRSSSRKPAIHNPSYAPPTERWKVMALKRASRLEKRQHPPFQQKKPPIQREEQTHRHPIPPFSVENGDY